MPITPLLQLRCILEPIELVMPLKGCSYEEGEERGRKKGQKERGRKDTNKLTVKDLSSMGFGVTL